MKGKNIDKNESINEDNLSYQSGSSSEKLEFKEDIVDIDQKRL